MKKLIAIMAVLIGLVTNQAQTTNTVETAKNEAGSWEFTLGGAGSSSKDMEDQVGLDFSISTNPLKALPNLWFSYNQEFYYEPDFGGASGLSVNWNWHLFGDLYLNTGYGTAILYDKNVETDDIDTDFRHGPEATFQYYVVENAFIFVGAAYDFVDKGQDGLRYSFGIGLAF